MNWFVGMLPFTPTRLSLKGRLSQTIQIISRTTRTDGYIEANQARNKAV
jgi:hypothetical protein